jgi:hypothetical protein
LRSYSDGVGSKTSARALSDFGTVRWWRSYHKGRRYGGRRVTELLERHHSIGQSAIRRFAIKERRKWAADPDGALVIANLRKSLKVAQRLISSAAIREFQLTYNPLSVELVEISIQATGVCHLRLAVLFQP